MKAIFSSNGFKSISRCAYPRVLFYSTEPLTSRPKVKKDTLYSRVSPASGVSVIPILDQWTAQGKNVNQDQLKTLIKNLRAVRRFKHALEISQWMKDRSHFDLSARDISIRLDLISKVHGVEKAVKYFDHIPKESRAFPVYLALLNSFAQAKSTEKAEALMQEMREMGFVRTSVAYNVLLNLYVKVGKYEKLDILVEEMKEKGINPSKFTFSVLLSAYAATSDVNEIEKILQMVEVNPDVHLDWHCYAIAANGYIKAGSIDKALEMLNKSEELVTRRKRKAAFGFLLTLYADAGRKEELYRIWNQYKSTEKVYNTAYQHMIGSLLKMDDIAGAEKILDEWESGGTTTYDFRVPNLLIAAYCKHGLLEKAEMFVKKAVEKGKKPFANTWEILAYGYIEADQIPKAVDAIKSGYLVRRPGWKPNRDSMAACLEHLKQEGDAVKTEEFVRLLGAPGHMSIDDCERLLDYIYIYSAEAESTEVNEMNGDDEKTCDSAEEAT